MQRVVRFLKKSSRVASLVVCCLMAMHVSAAIVDVPSLSERGPLRYLFDFDEPGGSRNVKVWAAANSRYAASAYTDEVGTKTDELSRLIFNDTNFKLTEAFPGCIVAQNAEYYNPLLKTVRINSKIDSRETNVYFGARYAYPVYKDVGRIGVRVTVPIKSQENRRLDVDGVPRGADLEEVMAVSGQIIPRSGASTTVSNVPMVRMDFAEALVQSNKNNPALDLSETTLPPTIGGMIISDAQLTDDSAVRSSVQRTVGVIRSPQGFIPRPPEVKNTAIVTSVPATSNTQTTPHSSTAADIAAADGTDAVLPEDGNAEYNTLYRLETVGNPGRYSRLADDTTVDINERVARQHLKEELWLIPRVFSSDHKVTGFTEGGALKTLTDLSEQVTENAFEWLEDRGYLFDTSYYAGFGDTIVDFFYEHAISDKCYGELFVGMVFPTAQDSKDFSSPYRAQLGNGKHYEARAGAMLAFQPIDALNLKADVLYSCVIPKEETRFAAFQGARIKNAGPLVTAEVGWNYYVARLEATIFHLKTRAISNMVGYEFYYKDRDALSFPRNNLSTWQGRTFDIDGSAIRKEYPLDATVATLNTDAIAHRCKVETSFRVTNQCEFCLGFGYTFAGKNIPQTVDGSLVLNVVF